jgi:hypothetical protein
VENTSKRIWVWFHTHVIGDFRNGWIVSDVFRKLWIRLLEVYDDLRGIGWNWQSLDSVSVKAPLGGPDRSKPYRQR